MLWDLFCPTLEALGGWYHFGTRGFPERLYGSLKKVVTG